MQRADGTYNLPDEKVSLVWQSHAGQLLRRASHGTHWTCLIYCSIQEPKPGRWLPWTPPVFLERKKCAWRLCRITLALNEAEPVDAAWSLNDDVYIVQRKWLINPCGVKKVVWLTPEYEDELTPSASHE